MANDSIKVKMLGEFTLEYKGQAFTIERNTVTKVNQLLQMLLYFPDGMAKKEILENLFNHEIIADPSNSLRALVFRLRKILPKCGLPNDEYVHIKRGTYSWTEDIPVDCDAHAFEKLANAAMEKENNNRIALLEQACDIYGGDFLPELYGAEWATLIQVKLRKLYFNCVKELCEDYINKADYKKLLEISQKAASLYPHEGYQSYQMQALIELGKKQEAMQLYEQTEKIMFEELGVSVNSKMTEMLDKLGGRIRNSTDLIATVQKNLETAKEDTEGAFYCSYPVFVESYRYIKRVISRAGLSAWLMLCTITDGKGVALSSSDRLEDLMEELSESIMHSLRGGDMYTRYSDNQFVILLLQTTKEDCEKVQDRINDNMSKESRRRYLQYHLTAVN